MQTRWDTIANVEYAKNKTKQSISLEYCAETTQRESIIGDDMTRSNELMLDSSERVEVERKLREREKHLNIWILIRNSGEERESVYSMQTKRRKNRPMERKKTTTTFLIYLLCSRAKEHSHVRPDNFGRLHQKLTASTNFLIFFLSRVLIIVHCLGECRRRIALDDATLDSFLIYNEIIARYARTTMIIVWRNNARVEK